LGREAGEWVQTALWTSLMPPSTTQNVM